MKHGVPGPALASNHPMKKNASHVEVPEPDDSQRVHWPQVTAVAVRAGRSDVSAGVEEGIRVGDAIR